LMNRRNHRVVSVQQSGVLLGAFIDGSLDDGRDFVERHATTRKVFAENAREQFFRNKSGNSSWFTGSHEPKMHGGVGIAHKILKPTSAWLARHRCYTRQVISRVIFHRFVFG